MGIFVGWRQRESIEKRKRGFSLREAKEVGEKLGVKWDKFSVEDFRKGMNHELEHGTANLKTNVTCNDPLLTGKIVLAHLNKHSDYYLKLKNIINAN